MPNKKSATIGYSSVYIVKSKGLSLLEAGIFMELRTFAFVQPLLLMNSP